MLNKLHSEGTSQEQFQGVVATAPDRPHRQATMPQAHLLNANESALFMKLPRLASSSLLFRATRSLHLKSVSDCSGRLLSR